MISESIKKTADRALLTTVNLTKRFGGLVAVDNVNLTVNVGELRCLIGPNGAGKSTFFKCLTGQFAPSSGSITFSDQELCSWHTHDIVRKGIGIKTQTPNLFDGLPVYENVSLSARRHNSQQQSKHITDEMLELLAISDLANRVVGNLAHGQRQLVELAMVLAGKPRLLLLDEPAAGMTGEERERLGQILQKLAGRTSLIVVEHDMQFIGNIATEITVFHRGKIFAEGSFKDIMASSDVQEIYLGKDADVFA